MPLQTWRTRPHAQNPMNHCCVSSGQVLHWHCPVRTHTHKGSDRDPLSTHLCLGLPAMRHTSTPSSERCVCPVGPCRGQHLPACTRHHHILVRRGTKKRRKRRNSKTWNKAGSMRVRGHVGQVCSAPTPATLSLSGSTSKLRTPSRLCAA